MELTRIYSSSNPGELALIKHALTTANIPFMITNESLLAGLGIAGMGGLGADVKVNSEDYDSAKNLLCELDLVCENKN